MDGVVLGNEVLDAMPVQLLHWDGRAVVRARRGRRRRTRFAWHDRPTALRRRRRADFVPGTVTEIHPQAEAFVRTLAGHMRRGAAFFIDYGFPEAEYYHPQRTGGTLMCHRAHQADADPLADVGREGHHRACQLQRHRAGRAGRRPGGAGLHLAGALPDQLRACRR